MLKMRRICVPLGLGCNLQCKYCYRDYEKIKIPEFTPDMINYLNNLSPEWCEAVIASGGEPLMYWDKVKELFSYVPRSVHKRIMTNATLLNQEMVDYINEYEIELHLSHDGPKTEFLRGVDVLKDPKILSLLRQIKIIRIWAVCTSYNCNVWENFFDTINKLGRYDENVFYDTFSINDIPSQHDCVDNFDYNTWARSMMEFKFSKYNRPNPYTNGRRLKDDPFDGGIFMGFNVLPNGIVCGMTHVGSVYGTIHTETYDELRQNMIKMGQIDECLTCSKNKICTYIRQTISPHVCKCRKMIMNMWNSEDIGEIKESLTIKLPILEEKYGFKLSI